MKLCQLIRMPAKPRQGDSGGRRWEFMAHGATYTAEEADEIQPRLEANGYKVRRLPVPAK